MTVDLLVVGDPIEHSLSPALHTAALASSGLDGYYRARRVDAAGMRTLVEQLRQGTVDGANVTMPHKSLAASLCDTVSSDAARAWSVNTLLPVDGTVVGYSTDITGIRQVWADAGFDDRPCLVLGAGGAAAAVLIALEGRELKISSRRSAQARDVVARTESAAGVLPWGKPFRGAIVVNATPLGMAGETLPARVVAKADGVFDMAYGSLPTPAISTAKERGLPSADGFELLVAQAALSFEIWTGQLADTDAMRAAIA